MTKMQKALDIVLSDSNKESCVKQIMLACSFNRSIALMYYKKAHAKMVMMTMEPGKMGKSSVAGNTAKVDTITVNE